MSHTLHREGSKEGLARDFVVLAMPVQGHTEGSGEKLRRFMDISRKYHPVNNGNSKAGNIYMEGGYERLRAETRDGGICHAVFTSPEDLAGFLSELKQEDMGISIVVSGLMDVVGECCHRVGLHPHTVNMSLGIYGRREKLVPDDVREVTTMCGHGMVTGDLVMSMVKRIQSGHLTPEEASKELAALCVCGIYNTERSAELLDRMAKR